MEAQHELQVFTAVPDPDSTPCRMSHVASHGNQRARASPRIATATSSASPHTWGCRCQTAVGLRWAVSAEAGRSRSYC